MDFPGFQPALWAATVMNAFDCPWGIAGGWALDLWRGHPTRDHGDVEVAILRDDQIALRDFLPDAKFFVSTPHGRLAPWRDRQMLMQPVHELHVQIDSHHELEILLNESDRGQWLYRRDARIRLPLTHWIIRAAYGVPVIAPEIALLYKSKSPQPRDLLDLHSTLEALDEDRRTWLISALQHTSPEHPWLAELTHLTAQSDSPIPPYSP